jgi:molecular chaperone DnaK (HSP70)
MSYAIDFGTSNTVIARWNGATEKAEIVKLSGLSTQVENNPPLIPSLVYVENASQNKVILGQATRDRGLDLASDPRFFRSFKRGIGTQIQGFLPELDGVDITFERIGEWFLNRTLEQLQQEDSQPLNSLIVTVPVDSFEAYRHWLAKICQGWNIDKIQMLDEPTAAALGYGINGSELLLVVDFGGGTIDLSLVQLANNKSQIKPQGFILKWGQKVLGESSAQKTKTARVLAKVGQNLGGADLDNWLVDYFVATEKVPQSALISRMVERLKIKLSFQEQANEVYFNDETFDSYELSLDRDRFESILQKQQFFGQLDRLMTQLLQQARRNGVEIEDIDRVLLVGGTVQIPAVQNWVKQYFDESKISCDRPFEAIATGALQLLEGYQISDFLYHGYGVRYWDRKKNCHGWHPIIKAGQSYPTSSPLEISLGASRENQPSIELIIGELGRETGSTQVYFDGARLVTRSLGSGETTVQPLNDRDGARSIASLNPPGIPGRDRLKVQFRVDEERFLRITVEDLLLQEILLRDRIVAQLS